jgi:hypothetical protein
MIIELRPFEIGPKETFFLRGKKNLTLGEMLQGALPKLCDAVSHIMQSKLQKAPTH